MQPVTSIVAGALLLAVVASVNAADRFPWLTDLDEARAIAESEQKPMLVVFRCEP